MIANLSPRRLWTIVGAAGALVIVALGYFLLISSENSSTDDLLAQAADSQSQAAISHAKVAELRKDNENLAQYKAQLNQLEQAIPIGASTAQFVTDMQRLGQQTKLKITAIDITPPDPTAVVIAPAATTATTSATTEPTGTPASAPTSSLIPLHITVTAVGPTAGLERFLSLLQNSEPRALLLGHVSESAPTGSAPVGSAGAANPTITISMTAFFANA